MSMDKINHTDRTIQISDDVLRQVAALSARDTAGVASLAQEKPVKITNLGGAISVEIRLFVKSGTRAANVAARVQQTVKQSIQDMTGVTAVHVHVEISGMQQEEL
ncbi:MAG: Asp23/Gls24 family envelope stress response protein [Oscillospiraceae bacterium]|nr:Asp23/Gls24 family envelope stress response protein [Oscillospiraceae bacterium]